MKINNLISGAGQYSENTQSIAGRFTICQPSGDGYNALEPTMKCRDYFSEWLVATYANHDSTRDIYGFVAKGKSKPIPLDKLYLFFDGNIKRLNENLHIINEIQPSKVEESVELVEVSKGCLITAPNFWLGDTFRLHFFTLLIRTLSDCSVLSNLEAFLSLKAADFMSSEDFRNFENGIKSLYGLGFLECEPSLDQHLDKTDGDTLKMYHNVGGCVNLGRALVDRATGDGAYKGAGPVEEQYKNYKRQMVGDDDKKQAAT